MVHLDNSCYTTVSGPLVANCAPCSGTSLQEVCKPTNSILTGWNKYLELKPSAAKEVNFWQYHLGDHSSEKRIILESVVLSILSNEGVEVNIRHMVIEGSSQCVIGGNLTRNCSVYQKNGDFLELTFHSDRGVCDRLNLISCNMQCYIPPNRLFHQEFHYITAHPDFMNICIVHLSDSKEVLLAKEKEIIDKVHHHVCGHSNF